jgi:hypothetical protein
MLCANGAIPFATASSFMLKVARGSASDSSISFATSAYLLDFTALTNSPRTSSFVSASKDGV